MSAIRLPLSVRRAREAVADVALVVRGDPFQAADRYRLFFHPAAAAGGLAGAVAGTAKNPGKDIGVPVDHESVGITASGDQADVFGTAVWAGHAHWQSTTLWK